MTEHVDDDRLTVYRMIHEMLRHNGHSDAAVHVESTHCAPPAWSIGGKREAAMQFRWTLVFALLMPAIPTAAVPITACGEFVPAGETGELMHDLACDRGSRWPFSATGVILDGGATLALNGFTISGDGSGVGIGFFPQSEDSARMPGVVSGPGTVSGFEIGVNAVGRTSLTVSSVTVTANTNGIIAPLLQTLVLHDVIASGNARDGIWAQDMEARDVEANGNGGRGVATLQIADAVRLHAKGTGAEGVRVGRPGAGGALVDSHVTGNGGLGRGFDILAGGPLGLRGTTCGRAARVRDGRRRTRIVGRLRCPGPQSPAAGVKRAS
jgi:hypothetical protein